VLNVIIKEVNTMKENVETVGEKVTVQITCPICSKKLNARLSRNLKHENWYDFIFLCPRCKKYALISKKAIEKDNKDMIC
jgi:hypothetical protein